jgi:hypothetical protein
MISPKIEQVGSDQKRLKKKKKKKNPQQNDNLNRAFNEWRDFGM